MIFVNFSNLRGAGRGMVFPFPKPLFHCTAQLTRHKTNIKRDKNSRNGGGGSTTLEKFPKKSHKQMLTWCNLPSLLTVSAMWSGAWATVSCNIRQIDFGAQSVNFNVDFSQPNFIHDFFSLFCRLYLHWGEVLPWSLQELQGGSLCKSLQVALGQDLCW